MAELDFIASLTRHIPNKGQSQLTLGIGDDCAVVRKDEQTSLLYTMDSLIAGVHFDLDFHPPHLLGRKAVAVNISDIAGMGGTPQFALLSICMPPSFSGADQQEFMEGFFSMCDEFGVTLIGGDTVSGTSLAITVTLIGEAKTGAISTRDGAGVGDEVWVSGTPGQSSVGLCLLQAGQAERFPQLVAAHLDPAPQVELGRLLAGSGVVTSMMDSSDGLATDLAHISRQSGCMASVDASLLPLSAILKEATLVTGQDATHEVLCGGEDYSLVFTTLTGHGKGLAQRVQTELGLDLHLIGEMVAGAGGVLLRDGNRTTDISFQGYEHTLNSGS